MFDTGLVSVSFRPLMPEQVAAAAVNAGLNHVEWGSDVHAPYNDPQRLAQIVALQEQYGIRCCSYGTYFRLAVTPMEELPGYIQAAKMLGTDILRLWCGTKRADECTAEERDYLFDQCRQAAAIAEKEGVTLCMECHMKTYTETKEGALELMKAVDSPAFKMYWQPNQRRTIAENVEYARLLREYITHIHVFQWKQKQRFPLAEGVEEWKTYLRQLPGDHMLLLEFMPDDDVKSLPAEAETLRTIKGV